MHKSLLGVMSVAILASGCASQAPDQAWTRWVCDSQVEVLWRMADQEGEQVDLRLGGDDIVHRLRIEPSGSGALYSDGQLSFHTKGEQGLVYRTATDDLIGRGCKAP